MIDQTTLAYVNLYAVLGALADLTSLDPRAQALLKGKKPTRLGIAVKGGPAATLVFEEQRCRLEEGVGQCHIKLAFSSPQRFNGMIARTVTPIPRKGWTRIFFLTRTFTRLTDRLTQLLRAKPEDLEDPDFLALSTHLMLGVVGEAVAQIANHDPIGMFSASNIVDGQIALAIHDGPAVTVECRDHRLTCRKEPAETPRAVMEFESCRLAHQLFDGQVNAVACIGSAQIRMRGMISMLDNLNRILDRVGLYLA